MKPARDSSAGLIALAIGGVLALNYPLLSLFDRGTSVFGIPLPFLYLFFVWTILIGGIAALIERHGDNVADNFSATRSAEGDSGTPLAEQRSQAER